MPKPRGVITYGTNPDTDRAPHWSDAAECLRHDAELWDPARRRKDYTNAMREADTARAKDICNTLCPVRKECLEWAYETRDDHLILGGLTRDERRAERRRQRAPRAPQTHCRSGLHCYAETGRDTDGGCSQCRRERNNLRAAKSRAANQAKVATAKGGMAR